MMVFALWAVVHCRHSTSHALSRVDGSMYTRCSMGPGRCPRALPRWCSGLSQALTGLSKVFCGAQAGSAQGSPGVV